MRSLVAERGSQSGLQTVDLSHVFSIQGISQTSGLCEMVIFRQIRALDCSGGSALARRWPMRSAWDHFQWAGGKNGFSEWNPEFLLLFLWRDATFCLLSLQKVSSTVIRGCAGENDIRAGDLSGGINTFKQAFLRGGVVFIPKRLPQTDGVLRC